MTNKKKKPILFVMSGGGLRGLQCHAGILQAMDERKIAADVYRGTSAGAIIASFNAAGMTGNDIADLIYNTPPSKLMKWNWKCFWPGQPIYTRDGTKEILKDILGEKTYENVVVTATDKNTDEPLVAYANYYSVLASSALPVIFRSIKVTIGDKVYDCVDGGVINNIPTPRGVDREKYEHIYIMICNNDVDSKRHYYTKTGNALRWYDTMSYREGDQVICDWKGFDNVTIIQPSPYKSSMMDWSEGLIEHCKAETLKILK